MSDDAKLDDFVESQPDEENSVKHKKKMEVEIPPKTVELPSSWELMELQEVGDLKPSNVDKKSRDSETPVELCNYMDVYNNEYITNELDFMRATASEREIERFLLDEGDVIFTKDSEEKFDIAVPAVVQDQLDNVLCGYHLFLIKPDNETAHSAYLSKSLQHYPVSSHLGSRANGTTRFGLTVSSTERAKVPIPPLPEQRKIATVLHTVDQAIQKAEKIVESIERAKRGVLQDTIFDVDSKESVDRRFGPKIFKIPEHWQRVRLQEVTDLITRGKQPTYADEGVPVINQECIYWDGFHFENIRYLDEKKAKEWKDKYFVSVGDVVINSTGRGTLGRAQTYAEDIERAVDSHVTIARPDTQKMTAGYLRYFLESNRGQGLLYSMCVTGSTGQIELSKSKLQLLSIPLPTKEEQKEIVNTLEQFDSNIRSQQKYKKQLDTLKQGLMQDLLSGEVRTTDVDIDIPEEVAKYG